MQEQNFIFKRFTNSFYKLLLMFGIIGPGLAVMLADTDAGSVVVAAQSGASWGYRLLLLQLLLIPILYIAQELTIRLGLSTNRGHGELIKQHFGKKWAWLSIGTLLICCIGAIITELSGLAAAGTLFNIPVSISVFASIFFLILIAWLGSYRSVERVALLLGAFELVFFIVAWKAHPNTTQILSEMTQIPWHDKNYLYLAAANIGAVIMPWMIFYQQSAVIDKGLTVKHLPILRFDTAIGAIITQSIMIAIIIACATTIGKNTDNNSLQTIPQISHALTPHLGYSVGRILFAIGISGASLVAAIVVSLTAAWGLGEITGYRRSLQYSVKQAPWFYSVYTLVLVISGLIVISGVNLINLNIAVEVMNALLLPIVLGFLFLLARYAAPEKYKIKGKYAVFVAILLAITSLFAVYAGISGLIS